MFFCYRFCRVTGTVLVLVSLFHVVTYEVYYVTPDVDYYADDEQQFQHSVEEGNDVYLLQHYVEQSEKYFTTDTHLHLLPGEHYLNSDVVIQDVERLTITGTKIDGIVTSTIHCTSPAGIAVVNSSYIILFNLKMTDCANNFTRLFDRYTLQYLGVFENVGLFVLNSWFVSITDLQLSQGTRSNVSECGIQALNILGKSVLNNTKANCLKLYYDSIENTTRLSGANQLYIENYISNCKYKSKCCSN